MTHRLHDCKNAGKAIPSAGKGRLEALFRCFEKDACPNHVHAAGAVYCALSPFFKPPMAEKANEWKNKDSPTA